MKTKKTLFFHVFSFKIRNVYSIKNHKININNIIINTLTEYRKNNNKKSIV